MTDMQTQPGELGPRQKARRTIATLTEAGYVGLPETLVLSAIYDLHERIERLERLAAQARADREAGDWLSLDSPGQLVGEMFPPAPVPESYRARLRCSKCGGRGGHPHRVGDAVRHTTEQKCRKT